MSINHNPKTQEIKYTYNSSESKSNYTLDNQFILLNASVEILSKDIIKDMKMDKRTVTLNKKNERVFKFFLDNEIKKEKGMTYTTNTVDATTLSLLLQNGLYHDLSDFYCDFIVEQLPMGSSIKVTRYETKDLTEIGPQYKKPKPIIDISKLSEKVIYFETAVQGIGSLFYPHKHYYIYQSKPPYRYIGTWGGPEDNRVFQYITKNIPIDSKSK